MGVLTRGWGWGWGWGAGVANLLLRLPDGARLNRCFQGSNPLSVSLLPERGRVRGREAERAEVGDEEGRTVQEGSREES